MPPEERRAGELLKTLLGAQRWLARDYPAGPPEMHDLDLVFEDGRRIAVEVTTHTSSERAEFERVLEKVNPVSAPSLSTGWEVNFRVPANRPNHGSRKLPRLKGNIVPKLPDLLERVERESLYEVVRYVGGAHIRGFPQDHEILSQLRLFGITSAYPASWVNRGSINLRSDGEVTGFDASNITETAEEHVDLKCESVQRATDDGADEVHLFIDVPLGVPRSDAALAATSVLEPDVDWPPTPKDMRGFGSVWVTCLAIRAEYPELHGFSSPIWQFTESGPYCWTLDWQRREP